MIVNLMNLSFHGVMKPFQIYGATKDDRDYAARFIDSLELGEQEVHVRLVSNNEVIHVYKGDNFGESKASFKQAMREDFSARVNRKGVRRVVEGKDGLVVYEVSLRMKYYLVIRITG